QGADAARSGHRRASAGAVRAAAADRRRRHARHHRAAQDSRRGAAPDRGQRRGDHGRAVTGQNPLHAGRDRAHLQADRRHLPRLCARHSGRQRQGADRRQEGIRAGGRPRVDGVERARARGEAVALQRQADALGHQSGFRQRDRGDRGRIRRRAARYRLQLALPARHRCAARRRRRGAQARRPGLAHADPGPRHQGRALRADADAGVTDGMASARIRRLTLSNFRSYHAAQVEVGAALVVLTGPNGAGKTNLIEAISFLAPGRGLRRATLEEVANAEGDGSWAIAADAEGAFGPVRLGTGIDPPAEGSAATRRFRLDQGRAASASAFADHLRVVWLVPEMDGLFIGPAGDRRRFLDRLVLAIDAEHGTRVNALERALRARNRLLEEAAPDLRWLDAAEHEVAELAVAVAAARTECVARLNAEIFAAHDPDSPFPDAALRLEGWMESSLGEASAIEIEDRYRQALREARERDRAAGRTLDGPHRSDLVVFHQAKQIPAARASTGERKALLVGLVLSHARLVTAMHGFRPLILLD